MNSSADFIYLDYAATTPVDPRVLETMVAAQGAAGDFGNPSSTHLAGRRSNENIAGAAEQLAALLHTTPQRLIWTSGATESNNLAIFGAARQRAHRGKHQSALGLLFGSRGGHRAIRTAAFNASDRRHAIACRCSGCRASGSRITRDLYRRSERRTREHQTQVAALVRRPG